MMGVTKRWTTDQDALPSCLSNRSQILVLRSAGAAAAAVEDGLVSATLLHQKARMYLIDGEALFRSPARVVNHAISMYEDWKTTFLVCLL